MSVPVKASIRILSGHPGRERSAALLGLLSELPDGARVSFMLEGVPRDGTAELPAGVLGPVHILAAGCPCCTGSLTLGVTLARILRLERPTVVIIALVDSAHESSLRALLKADQWAAWIEFGPVLEARAGPKS